MTQKSETPKSADKAPPTEAQKSFTELKSLAGTWQGPVTIEPAQPGIKNGEPGQISLHVTSRGNALVHEMKEPGTPDDPTKDDPITMLYLDGDRLLLTHYCDAGNRPRMTGKMSADGKTVEFEFLDVAGNTTANTLSGMQQNYLANQGQGVAAAQSALDAQNYGANATLAAEAQQRMQQFQAPGAGPAGQATGTA